MRAGKGQHDLVAVNLVPRHRPRYRHHHLQPQGRHGTLIHRVQAAQGCSTVKSLQRDAPSRSPRSVGSIGRASHASSSGPAHSQWSCVPLDMFNW